MVKVEESTTTKTITPQALAKRMGISDKRVRAILRSDYPRAEKKKRWEISVTLANKVARDYKAAVKEREAKKQVEIQKQLKGDE